MSMKNYKLGKVTSCTFTTTWLNPITNKIIYYHDVVTDIGDSGSCGTMEMDSPRIKVGEFIEYEIDAKGKLKLHASSADKGSLLNPANNIAQKSISTKNTKSSKSMDKPTIKQYEVSKIKGHEAFLGYAWSYAKDLLVAGKTMEDMQLLKNMATFIYDEIGEHIKNGRTTQNE